MKTIKQDEIWVGNTTTGGDMSDLQRVEFRIGEQAYDIHGKQIPRDYMRPLFVKKSSYDLYNAIMQAQLEKIRNS